MLIVASMRCCLPVYLVSPFWDSIPVITLRYNICTGNDVLGSLREQRETLKGAHKRIMDIGNTLGLSNHTMKLIERRIHEDKYVVFGGMGVTLIIIFVIIYYFVL